LNCIMALSTCLKMSISTETVLWNGVNLFKKSSIRLSPHLLSLNLTRRLIEKSASKNS
jgi:hypothetical protein